MLKTFYKIFPTPNYLSMPAAGIEISDSAVRGVMLRNHTGTKVRRTVEEPLSPGVLEGGYINDAKALTEALVKVRQTLSTPYVLVALPEEKMYIFDVTITLEEGQSLRSAIEIKLEENIPIPPAEAVFEYEILSSSGETHEVSVTAFSYEVVTTYLGALTDAGFIVKSFGSLPHAFAKALTPDKTGTQVFIQFQPNKTGVFVVSKGVPRYSSTVPIGGTAIDEAIAKTFKVNSEEARILKREHGYIETEKTKEIFNAAAATFSAVSDEIQKVMMYWQSHGQGGIIDEIILTGEDALLIGLTEYIFTTTKIVCHTGNPWRALPTYNKQVPPLDKYIAFNFVPSLGLALCNSAFEHHI